MENIFPKHDKMTTSVLSENDYYMKYRIIFTKFQGDWIGQEPLNSYLDGAANQKIWKPHFLGNISNSCCWVTWMGLKPTQKDLFEKISKNTAATVVQNFGLIEGAAELPLKQSQKFDLK